MDFMFLLYQKFLCSAYASQAILSSIKYYYFIKEQINTFFLVVGFGFFRGGLGVFFWGGCL